MNKLPLWRLTTGLPGFEDSESSTTLEQSYRLYQAMNTLIDEYNAFATGVNEQIDAFMTSTNQDLEVFAQALRQEFQDFIDVVNLKIADYGDMISNRMQEFVNEYFNDRANEVIAEITTNQYVELKTLFNEQLTTINQMVVDLNERVTGLEVQTNDNWNTIINFSQRVERLETRVDGHDDRFVNLENNVRNIQTNYLKKTELGNQLLRLDSKILTLENTIGQLEDRIKELENTTPTPVGYNLTIGNHQNADLTLYQHYDVCSACLMFSTDNGTNWEYVNVQSNEGNQILSNVSKVIFKNTCGDYICVAGSNIEDIDEFEIGLGGTYTLNLSADKTIYIGWREA